MKKNTFIYLLFIALLLPSLSSCNKKQTKEITYADLPSNVPDCEVSSAKGELQSFCRNSSICSCYGGLPYCQIKSKDKDSIYYDTQKSVITTSADVIPLYDAHIQYIANDLKNPNAAEALSNIKKLFVNNNYHISTPELLEEYYKNFRIYTAFYKAQPLRVRDKLDNNLQN